MNKKSLVAVLFVVFVGAAVCLQLWGGYKPPDTVVEPPPDITGPAWGDVTPNYFLDENISDRASVPGDIDTGADDTIRGVARTWYDESGRLLMTAVVMGDEKRIPGQGNRSRIPPNTTRNISDDMALTHLRSFSFNGEIVDELRVDVKQDTGTLSTFYLKWSEDKFTFSIKTTLAEYRHEMRKLAENIIKRYPK
ncbi:MAG: hypothetical protein KAU03_06620 [Candidatus Altiarchaeales archaeon]|nr:hypothetical protein [Candidatus Altiarchaeales archaeon]